MHLLLPEQFNTASIFWIILLCFFQSASHITKGEIHIHGSQNSTEKHIHQNMIYHTLNQMNATKRGIQNINLNYLKYSKREESMQNEIPGFSFHNFVRPKREYTGKGNEQKFTQNLEFNTAPDTENSLMGERLSKLTLEPGNKLLDITDSPAVKESNIGLNTSDQATNKEVSTTEAERERSIYSINNVTSLIHKMNSTDFNAEFGQCLSNKCNKSQELQVTIYPDQIAVELGSNVTFKCTFSTNDTKEYRVFWLQTREDLSSTTAVDYTLLHLRYTVQSDSGLYKCIKWEPDYCCHVHAVLKVYIKPPYVTHLIMVGVIALIGFIMCSVVEIWRSYRMKTHILLKYRLQGKEEPLFAK